MTFDDVMKGAEEAVQKTLKDNKVPDFARCRCADCRNRTASLKAFWGLKKPTEVANG